MVNTNLSPLTLVKETSNQIQKVFSREEPEDESNTPKGLRFERVWTKEEKHPFDEVEWVIKEAQIKDDKNNIIFAQRDVEAPSFWSDQAINIVVSKYFRGRFNSPERERSVKQMISRVVKVITEWGRRDNYFKTEKDAQIFEEELTHLILNQKATFNSPVWFNVGVKEKPQCSACFILAIEDDMNSILEWIRQEGLIFKGGSGSGINISVLRSSKENLSGGGIASGPLSFMRAADASAGAIKSGGTTRRAAKMVIMNVSHPDIIEFIKCKAEEEKKAWALGEAGYDMSLNGEAWSSVQFQNANNSIRVNDDFMKAVEEDGDWALKFVTTNETAETAKARSIMKEISDAAWICGDPGLQFDSTINRWHTCPNSGRINASNPCSEYMFLDNSACNLASINLMKFIDEHGDFLGEDFQQAINIIITAQEIIVGNSGYPTDKIAKNSNDYRPLGLGYANLGALLMVKGYPYDSEEGRNYAGALTSIMTGQAYTQSALIAKEKGTFNYFEPNREAFLKVINRHRYYANELNKAGVTKDILVQAKKVWDEAYDLGSKYGFRNAQVTVLAPTGTIAFMMDCDTTGIEPEIALVKYKWLVGGGMIKMINRTVPRALKNLGYREKEIEEIIKFIEENDTIEGAPHIKEKHLSVFDCAFKSNNGTRSIHYLGHVKIMAAVQPFISGAISKTVNMPNNATPKDISEVYLRAWKFGLKAIAIYRDGCKRTQPLTTNKNNQNQKETARYSQRRAMPDERQSITHKFTIGGHKGYLTVGLYEDGRPGEVFVVMSKAGSTIAGLMDAFATSISWNLQYGVPLKALVRKFAHSRFEPAGYTNDPRIRIATSVVDYIFRWLAFKFLTPKELMDVGLGVLSDANEELQPQLPLNNLSSGTNQVVDGLNQEKASEPIIKKDIAVNEDLGFENQSDAPFCSECGMIMIRNGSCYKCLNCGSSSGCS